MATLHGHGTAGFGEPVSGTGSGGQGSTVHRGAWDSRLHEHGRAANMQTGPVFLYHAAVPPPGRRRPGRPHAGAWRPPACTLQWPLRKCGGPGAPGRAGALETRSGGSVHAALERLNGEPSPTRGRRGYGGASRSMRRRQPVEGGGSGRSGGAVG